VSGYLREFQPGLILDVMEDLVDWEVRGVKVMEPSTFAVSGERPPGELGLGVPLRVSSSCWLKVLMVIVWDIRFGSHPVKLNT